MARDPSGEQEHLAVQARLAAAVIAVAAVIWVLGNILGSRFGWAPRYAFLLDFMAAAAFIWGLVVTWRVWRRRDN